MKDAARAVTARFGLEALDKNLRRLESRLMAGREG
jgi:hypothetical protein